MTKHTRIALLIFGGFACVALALYVRTRADHAKLTNAQGNGAPAGASSGAPGTPGASGERVVPVSVAKVERRDVPVYLEGLGTVTSLATVTVKSQVDGRLEGVFFKEGDPVKKGDRLAQIDPRPYILQLHQAQAALGRDEAQLKNGQLNLQRNETLRSQNLIAQKDVDDQRALVAQLDSAVLTDRAQIENAQLMLDYARITSPVSGVTGVRLVDPGNLVHASDTTGIVVVTQLDPIAVLFTLPQDDLPHVQKAMANGKLRVEAYARDGVQKLGDGELGLVDNQVNVQTATIRLKAMMPNPDKKLWPNAFVKTRLHLETMKGALVLPASVVQHGPDGIFGYVVGNDNVVAARPLSILSTQGDLAVLANGAAEGERFVTDGQNQLKPGGRVSPREKGEPGSKGHP